jgi:hypothetical protein
MAIFGHSRQIGVTDMLVKSRSTAHDFKPNLLNSMGQNLLTIAINRLASSDMIMGIVNFGGLAGDVGCADNFSQITALQAAIIINKRRPEHGLLRFSNKLILEMIAAPSTLTLAEKKGKSGKVVLKKNNVSARIVDTYWL